MSERLQKVMAHAGVASRRKSEELITTGHVKVNGKVANQLGTSVDEQDEIEVDGNRIQAETKVVFAFNKPRGVITSNHDEHDRKTISDFFKKIPERVYPVGRLDYDTNGLLLVTNDGQLAYELTHPKYEIDKTYQAKLSGVPDGHDLKRLENGIKLDHKYTSAKAEVTIDKIKEGNAWVTITIHEGKNHEVKKMFQAVNHPVEKLTRISFASQKLGNLKPGEIHPLNKRELRNLKETINKKTE